MKEYKRSWSSRVGGIIGNNWSSLPQPMYLKINEDKSSNIFISAYLEFFGLPKEVLSNKNKGSLYYKIKVNGKTLVQYHMPNKRGVQKKIDVNLHGKTRVPPGENIVEVLCKVSENGSWDLLQYQNQRQLSVLSFPED